MNIYRQSGKLTEMFSSRSALGFSFSGPVSFSFSGPSRRSPTLGEMNTSLPYWSMNTALVSLRLYYPKVATSC